MRPKSAAPQPPRIFTCAEIFAFLNFHALEVLFGDRRQDARLVKFKSSPVESSELTSDV